MNFESFPAGPDVYVERTKEQAGNSRGDHGYEPKALHVSLSTMLYRHRWACLLLYRMTNDNSYCFAGTKVPDTVLWAWRT